MPLLVLLLGASVATGCCALGASSDERRELAAERTSDAQSSMIKSVISSLQQDGTRQYHGGYNFSPFAPSYRPHNKCPLCDSSVYPYCGEKLFHDACCCNEPHNHDLPQQCRLADCRFLHANNCKEHRLIAYCCCSDDYRLVIKSLAKERPS